MKHLNGGGLAVAARAKHEAVRLLAAELFAAGVAPAGGGRHSLGANQAGVRLAAGLGAGRACGTGPRSQPRTVQVADRAGCAARS